MLDLEQGKITLAHGAGGEQSAELLTSLIYPIFNSEQLELQEDQARFSLTKLQTLGDKLAFTTDSYVISPLQFKGGDIGKLAVCGTLNDLAVGGARPMYLSVGLILEEGLPLKMLRDVLQSMALAAAEAGVEIVTGDTKVVPRGMADQLFINTSGIGVIPSGIDWRANAIQQGDCILINGSIGDHGAAVADSRGELGLSSDIVSDCANLYPLVEKLQQALIQVRCMRDATRGGVAAVLNEFAEASGSHLQLDESALPFGAGVLAVCEMLGFDPLNLANEGKFLMVVPPEEADRALEVLRAHPLGRAAAIIGDVPESYRGGMVSLRNALGSARIVDRPVGELLPRIC